MSAKDGPVAVVGAGIVGLSAARALGARGIEFDLYEPGDPGEAQSTGESRLFRHAHDDPRMVEFTVRGRSIWRQWEKESGQELISPGGALAIGETALARLEVMKDVPGVDARPFSPGEIANHLPVLAAYDGPATFDPDGGTIRTRLTIAWLYRQVAERLVPERVVAVETSPGDGASVTTPVATRNYRAVIVCAGTATAALARGAGIDTPVEVQAQVRSTFAIKEPAGRPALACLQDSSGSFGESGSYGSPLIGSRHFALGLSDAIDVPAGADLGPVPPDHGQFDDLIERTAAYVEEALPGLDPRPLGHVRCYIPALPWGEDGVAIWSDGPLYFLEGHNLFKQAPALGEALADTVMDQAVPDLLKPDSKLGADS